MKEILTLLLALFTILVFEAQTQQLANSTTIIGMWNQTGGIDYEAGNNNTLTAPSNFYKIINTYDGTFLTFVSTPKAYTGDTPIISQYGTYKIEPDGMITEHIDQHVINPRLIGKDVTLKYKLQDENTLVLSWSPNEGKTWIDEVWTRVPSSIPDSRKDIYPFLFSN
ncbi:MAG: DUF4488 domain-containing protein [Flavobacteriaceae bacterium]